MKTAEQILLRRIEEVKADMQAEDDMNRLQDDITRLDELEYVYELIRDGT